MVNPLDLIGAQIKGCEFACVGSVPAGQNYQASYNSIETPQFPSKPATPRGFSQEK